MGFLQIVLCLHILWWTHDISICQFTTSRPWMTTTSNTQRTSLMGGSSSYGYVRLNRYGRYYQVCDDSYWDDTDAKVACKDLGFSYGVAVKNVQLVEPYYYSYYYMYQIQCQGTELSLFSCTNQNRYRSYYGSYYSRYCKKKAMVSCSKKPLSTTSKAASIKLNTTSGGNFGRVIINYRGLTLQPCRSTWSDAASKQLCIKMGFKTGMTFGTTDKSPELGIWLQKNNCTNSSESTGCLLKGSTISTCDDPRHISVICSKAEKDFEVKLTGGSNKKEGRVEIMFNGKWGTICDKTWDAESAVVICRHLGYEAGIPKFNAYGSTGGTIIVNQINCNGNESSIFHCMSRGWEDQRNMEKCPAQYQSAGVQCEPPLKLAGYAVDAGNVEVFQGTSWNSVCGTNWGTAEALVTCKQLGYNNGIPICCNSFGAPPYYSNLPSYHCTGNETKLSSCSMKIVGCYVDGYASVHCFNGPTSITQVSLRGGKMHRGQYISGTVFVTQNKMMGKICSQSMDSKSANVTCKQLGYKGGVSYMHPYEQYNRPVFLIRLSCSGLEDNLDKCTIDKTLSVSKCNYAGVLCFNQTGGDVAVSLDHGGPAIGKVGVTHDGEKGIICNRDWDDNDANVLCRQLQQGYNGGKSGREISTNVYAEAVGSGFKCTGDEESIFQCPNDGWKSDKTDAQCDHTNAATVMCFKDVGLGDYTLNNGVVYGRIEIFHKKAWLNVCPDEFNSQAASVICKTFGYNFAKTMYMLDSDYYTNKVNFKCEKNAAKFSDCKISKCTKRSPTIVVSLLCSSKKFTNEYVPKVSSTGELTVYYNGIPGRVCSKNWDYSAAVVVCKQLGYRTGVATRPYYSTSMNTSAPYWMLNAKCSGIENRLTDCVIEEGSDCSMDTQSAGVYCTNGTDVRYRLNGNKRSGRVEIYLRGAWRSVCASYRWTSFEASVICRQMGFVKGSATRTYAYTSNSIGISKISCTGKEKTLLECRSTIGYSSCRYIGMAHCVGDVTLSTSYRASPNIGPVFYLNKNSETGPDYGYVCDTGFDDRAADVVCRYLYFSGGKHLGPSTFGTRSYGVTYVIKNVKCSGGEKSLTDCSKDPATPGACSAYASVICYNSSRSNDITFSLYPYSSYSTVVAGDVAATYLGQRGYICDDAWDDNDAQVICRQMRGSRYIGKAVKSRNSLVFSSSSYTPNPIWFSNVKCSGKEAKLQDCPHAGFGNGQICRTTHKRAAALCSSQDIKLRITGYNNRYRGLAEISINGLWGTICTNYYGGATPANIFCKQMGFKGGDIYRSTTTNRYSRYWVNYMNCAGTEQSIFECAATWLSRSSYSYCRQQLMVHCYNSVRLSTGIDNAGRLEVLHRGSWYSVTNTGFTRATAKLVCRAISNDYVDGIVLTDSYIQPRGRGGTFNIQLNCSASATDLSKCSKNLEKKTTNVTPQQVVYLYCSNVSISDNLKVSNVRIRGSSNGYRGSLVASIGNIEGDICPVEWGPREATVACKSFKRGYVYGIPYRSTPKGPSHPFILGKVNCNGTETSLSQCGHSTLGDALGCNITTGPAGVYCTQSEIKFELLQQENVRNRTFVLSMKFNGRRSRVCQTNDWAARLVCRKKGYQDGYSVYQYSGSSRETVSISQIYCDGWETNIYECRMTWTSSRYYTCRYHIGCTSSVHIISTSRYSSVFWMGTITWLKNNIWQSFCRKDWTQENSQVACSQLGFNTGRTICCQRSYSYRPKALGLNCTGRERSLNNCQPISGDTNCSTVDSATVLCASGDLTNYRLTRSSMRFSHFRLSVSYDGVTGRVCPDGWTDEDARVACRQFGYSYGQAYTHLDYYYSSASFLLGNPGCQGDERRINDCQKGSIGNAPQCSSPHSAGVVCSSSILDLEFSIKGGSSDNTGYVEMRYNGVSYGLCNTYFGMDEAQVLCREMGFSSGVSYRTSSNGQRYPSGIRVQLNCLGNETSLKSCPRSNVMLTSYCTIVSVTCYHRVRVNPNVPRGNMTSGLMGPLQVYQQRKWLHVSSANFSHAAALSACRDMGYPYGVFLCCSAFGNISISSTDLVSCGPADLERRGNCSIIGEESANRDDYASVICSKFDKKEKQVRWVSRNDTGYVEVSVLGQWGRICGTTWDDTAAAVFCRSQDYTTGIAYMHAFSYNRYNSRFYGLRMPPAVIGDVRCNGTEKTILDCDLQERLPPGGCGATTAAGVICFNSVNDANIGYNVSGGVSMENVVEGVVEVRIGRVWGTACKDSFGAEEANVLCTQLGWNGGKTNTLLSSRSSFRTYTGPVWLSNLNCKGNEKVLHKCPHAGYSWTPTPYRYYYQCNAPAAVTC